MQSLLRPYLQRLITGICLQEERASHLQVGEDCLANLCPSFVAAVRTGKKPDYCGLSILYQQFHGEQSVATVDGKVRMLHCSIAPSCRSSQFTLPVHTGHLHKAW